MALLPVKVLGTGLAVPGEAVTDAELERRLELPSGWIRKTGGVRRRHFARGEPSSEIGARAATQALAAAGIEASELDLILSASGTQEQVIPCTASFVQRALGLADSGIPSYDVNATCLSFLSALESAAHFIAARKYRRVLIVSSEIASVGIDWTHRESCTILGDGAGAVVLGEAPRGASEEAPCGIVASLFRTYSSQAELCRIRGGGTKLYPTRFDPADPRPFLFEMNGMGAFRFVSQKIEPFLADLFRESGLAPGEVDCVIPHQASKLSMDLILRRRLGIPEEKLVDILPEYGNTVAASIPMALHVAVSEGRLRRGQTALLLGTSAGMSLGGTVLSF